MVPEAICGKGLNVKGLLVWDDVLNLYYGDDG